MLCWSVQQSMDLHQDSLSSNSCQTEITTARLWPVTKTQKCLLPSMYSNLLFTCDTWLLSALHDRCINRRQRAHFWHPKQRQFVELSDCLLFVLFTPITEHSAHSAVIEIRASIYLPLVSDEVWTATALIYCSESTMVLCVCTYTLKKHAVTASK